MNAAGSRQIPWPRVGVIKPIGGSASTSLLSPDPECMPQRQ